MENVQLIKKRRQGGYKDIFPKTFLNAIRDKESGVSLTEILQGFNMYFLSHTGSRESTRLQIPSFLRREGLWITYVLYDHTVITEWYNSEKIDDESWQSNSNWRVGSNALVGDISISSDGYWVINGIVSETKAQGEQGVTPLLRIGDNNKLQVSYNEGKQWNDISDLIVPKFRWLQGEGTTAGTVQISMDLGKTWSNLSNPISNNLRIKKYIGINESLPTSGVEEGTIYMKGPYYAEGDTLNENPIYRMWIYAWKGNTLAWQDNGEFTSIAAGIVQETGNSETEVMSQKAVSEKISELDSQLLSYITTEPKIDFINNQINIYKGYAVIGEKGFIYNEQVLSFNEIQDDEYLVFNLNSKTFEVYPSVGYKAQKGYFVIATIIKGNFNIMVGNFPRKNHETGYIFGNVSFAFDKDKWTVDVEDSVYYEILKNSDVYKITKKQILISNMNYAFLFVNNITKELEVIQYNKVKDIPTENYVFIGFVDPNDKKVFAQISSIMIDGNEIVYFTQKEKDIFGKVVEGEYPVKDWMSKSFPAQATEGEIFLDKRCKIDYYHRLKKIRINCHTSGELEIIYLDANFNHVYTQKVTAESYGVQEFNEPGISYDQPYFYVAIKSKKEGGSMSVSSADVGNQYGCVVKDGTSKPLGYEYGYSIEVEDTTGTLVSRIEKIEQSITTENQQTNVNAMLSESDVVTLAPKDYYISEPIVLTSGKVLQGSFGKTRLILSNGCKTAISASNANDVKISDIEIVGTCSNYVSEMNGIVPGSGYDTVMTEDDALSWKYMGDEIGVNLDHCEKVVLNNIKVFNINGSAFKINNVGKSYIYGLNATNIFISNCYNGIYGYNEHEFSHWTNFTITKCMIGLFFESGNLIWTAGHITRCRVGLMMTGGFNHAHGICNGMEIKHNQIAGILCKNVVYGQMFQGIYMQYCDLILRDCVGIHFDTLFVQNNNIVCSSVVSGNNWIENLVIHDNKDYSNVGNLTIYNQRKFN